MKILLIGSDGLIGKNMIARMESQKDKDYIIYNYDSHTPLDNIRGHIMECEGIYFLAPLNADHGEKLYDGSLKMLLDLLRVCHNSCPVLVLSYGQSGELMTEDEILLHTYALEVNPRAGICKLDDVFGKWDTQERNSNVAKLFHAIAGDGEIPKGNDQELMNLYYIDDVIDALFTFMDTNALPDAKGYYRPDPKFLYSVTRGKLVELLHSFSHIRDTKELPNVADPLTKKLYSTYLSYLPSKDFSYPLNMNKDSRGSFTEIMKTQDRGQLSVNVVKPGVKKGEHWHHTKVEKFLVVSGKARICLRNIIEERVIRYDITGDVMQVIDIPPGYTHNIINTGKTDLIVIIWANERFDPQNPDTYYLRVENED